MLVKLVRCRLEKLPDGARLLVMSSLDGPQNIELEMTVKAYALYGEPIGSVVTKIFLLVSEHPF